MQMPTTQTIPAEQRARTSDPDTSHDAAAKSATQLSTLQEIVLGIFASHGAEIGLTDDELCAIYDRVRDEPDNVWPIVRYETPRKRRSDLTRLHRLVDSGIRRPNGFGSLEVVWMVAS